MSYPRDVCAHRDYAVNWHVYDWARRALRYDVHAVCSTTARLWAFGTGGGSGRCPYCADPNTMVEQRCTVLVLPALRWVAVDVPLEQVEETVTVHESSRR